MKKPYRILQLQFYKGTHTSYKLHTHASREFYIQNPILHAEDKELFEYYCYIQRAKRPSFQKRNSTHRRQGDLLEIHLCVTSPYKGIPGIPDIPVFPDIPVVPDLPVISDIPVIHDLPAFQAILQVPVSPGNPPYSSILRLECIFYIFYKFYSSIGLHRNSTEYQLNNTNILQTLHSSKKGRCCDIGQNTYR